MPELPGVVAYVVLGVPLLALLVGTSVRRVPAGHQLLVVRGQLVRRVGHRGLVARRPLLDSFVEVDSGPEELLVAVSTTTADRREVRLLVAATWCGRPWPPGASYRPPAAALEEALERALAEVVAGLEVDSLPGALAGRLPGLAGAVRVDGAEVADLELAEVDVVLRPDGVHDGAR
jgi:hypothetical protein